MLIEAFQEILRDVVLAVLWIGAAVLGLSVGSSCAVLGLGSALRARVARPHPTPPPEPEALFPPGETPQS